MYLPHTIKICNGNMLAETIVAIGCILVALLFLFVIGASIPLPPYPELPGTEIDDNCPGHNALSVPWTTSHSSIRKAHTAASGFNKLVDAGLVALIDEAAVCFDAYSRPVAIALIMECAAPIVCPEQTDVFVHWYRNMALVYYIDDRITDETMLRTYRKTLPVLTFTNKSLANVAKLL